MKLVIALSTLLPLALAASLTRSVGNEELPTVSAPKLLSSQPYSVNPVVLPPELMRSLISKVAQRVVEGRTLQKRSELQKPSAVTTEDVQKYYLATEEAKKTPRQTGQAPVGLTPEEFQQYLSAAVQFQPVGKYNQAAVKSLQRGLPIKMYASGAKVKRGSNLQRSGYGSPSAEYHTYDAGVDSHQPHYPTKVLHYDEEDARTRNAVFDALWRAFQAITGGVMVIGGQIAKGSGYLLQAKGRLLAETGPAVSDFGRSIAAESLNPHVPVIHPPVHHYQAKPYVVRHVHRYASKPVYGSRKPYYKPYVTAHSHHVHDISEYVPAIEASINTHKAFKVAAAGTTRAIGDLVHEVSNAAARAYLIKE